MYLQKVLFIDTFIDKMFFYLRLFWKPHQVRNAIHPLWPCPDPSSFHKLVYHPHMGWISISRKERILLSPQLRFSQCKQDPISSPTSPQTPSVNSLPFSQTPEDSLGGQLCSQMLTFAWPNFLKPLAFDFLFNHILLEYIGCCWSL